MTRKQPKPKTPKPVEAWMVTKAGLPVMDGGSMVPVLYRFPKWANADWDYMPDLHLVPVRIVPIVKRTKRTKRRSKP